MSLFYWIKRAVFVLHFGKLIGIGPEWEIDWLFRNIQPVAVLIFMGPRLAVYKSCQVPCFFIAEQLVFVTGTIRHIVFM